MDERSDANYKLLEWKLCFVAVSSNRMFRDLYERLSGLIYKAKSGHDL